MFYHTSKSSKFVKTTPLAKRRRFNSLPIVWKCAQSRSLVFDILLTYWWLSVCQGRKEKTIRNAKVCKIAIIKQTINETKLTRNKLTIK